MSIRSAIRSCPAARNMLHGVVEHQVGVPDQLVQRVEVPADPLDALQRLAQLAERRDRRVADPGGPAVLLVRPVLVSSHPFLQVSAVPVRAVSSCPTRVGSTPSVGR